MNWDKSQRDCDFAELQKVRGLWKKSKQAMVWRVCWTWPSGCSVPKCKRDYCGDTHGERIFIPELNSATPTDGWAKDMMTWTLPLFCATDRYLSLLHELAGIQKNFVVASTKSSNPTAHQNLCQLQKTPIVDFPLTSFNHHQPPALLCLFLHRTKYRCVFSSRRKILLAFLAQRYGSTCGQNTKRYLKYLEIIYNIHITYYTYYIYIFVEVQWNVFFLRMTLYPAQPGVRVCLFWSIESNCWKRVQILKLSQLLAKQNNLKKRNTSSPIGP